MNEPNILHFIEFSIPGGAESLVLDLCLLQRAAGLNPMIAHFDHPHFNKQCQELAIPSFTLPARSQFKKSATLPLFALKLARSLRRSGIALLHSHLFGPIVGGSIASFLARIPHVGTLHDIHMIEEDPTRLRQLQACLLLGTRLVAVSRHTQEFYASRVRYRSNRITCIHNGVRLRHGTPVTRQSLGIENGLVAIMVGRLVPLKRVHDAIEALNTLRAQHRIHLLVVGGGPELPGLQSRVERLGMKSIVSFLGERSDVAELLAISDLFLQCSETEGLSMAIIEALHAGLPCIVSNVGGNPELVSNGENGFLFEAGDVDALVRHLSAVANEPRRLVEFGMRSKELAARQFTAESCASSYLDMYEQMGLRRQPRQAGH